MAPGIDSAAPGPRIDSRTLAVMLLLLLFVLLIGVPLAELYVVIRIGEAIGILPTLGLMALDAVLGSMLMRSQGRAVWRRFRAAVASGRPPAREVLDGALVIAGGALLIAPGFLTDVFGALLLAPPTRAIARRLVVRHFTGRLIGGAAGAWGRRASQRRASQRRAQPADQRSGGPGDRPWDVEGVAVETDGPELHR